jgi:hypothetical protein
MRRTGRDGPTGFGVVSTLAHGTQCCDQAALNYTVWTERLPVHPLPALCNWTCHLAIPAFLARNGTLSRTVRASSVDRRHASDRRTKDYSPSISATTRAGQVRSDLRFSRERNPRAAAGAQPRASAGKA